MNTKPQDRNQVAQWAAAHAIVGALTQRPIVEISIKPHPRCLAYARYDGFTGLIPTVAEMRKQLVLSVSGAVAVGQFTVEAAEQARRIAQGIVAITGGSLNAEIDDAKVQAHLLLSRQKAAITRVAEQLLARESLTREEVFSLLN